MDCRELRAIEELREALQESILDCLTKTCAADEPEESALLGRNVDEIDAARELLEALNSYINKRKFYDPDR